ncbi:hypothetical protein PUNSTDRAFT_42477 [Punctularia strigosozonata HHB-11173 SS5]|uniref:uncharacterized protein n=1 Tax=Punctularia strigosozonata (strain HHB-11173) TaxID=741275 RepID=UPI0004416973|nr:uncharacterized protein PUNSTDRAFT_42477 [Punctularia strigosozonata HHB-11173 SS5]EIN13071.1 hypothetical protein PUNSTDRAFT_42477 [Punctularia strigosozonata HHB-11173 SS5]
MGYSFSDARRQRRRESARLDMDDHAPWSKQGIVHVGNSEWNNKPIRRKTTNNQSPVDMRLLGQISQGVYRDDPLDRINPVTLQEYYGGGDHEADEDDEELTVPDPEPEDPALAELVDEIGRLQEKNLRHKALRVARHSNPFEDNEEAEEAFWEAAAELQRSNIIPRFYGVHEDEQDSATYPDFETIRWRQVGDNAEVDPRICLDCDHKKGCHPRQAPAAPDPPTTKFQDIIKKFQDRSRIKLEKRKKAHDSSEESSGPDGGDLACDVAPPLKASVKMAKLESLTQMGKHRQKKSKAAKQPASAKARMKNRTILSMKGKEVAKKEASSGESTTDDDHSESKSDSDVSIVSNMRAEEEVNGDKGSYGKGRRIPVMHVALIVCGIDSNGELFIDKAPRETHLKRMARQGLYISQTPKGGVLCWPLSANAIQLDKIVRGWFPKVFELIDKGKKGKKVAMDWVLLRKKYYTLTVVPGPVTGVQMHDERRPTTKGYAKQTLYLATVKRFTYQEQAQLEGKVVSGNSAIDHSCSENEGTSEGEGKGKNPNTEAPDKKEPIIVSDDEQDDTSPSPGVQPPSPVILSPSPVVRSPSPFPLFINWTPPPASPPPLERIPEFIQGSSSDVLPRSSSAPDERKGYLTGVTIPKNVQKNPWRKN